jgi:hypothetical protein
VNPREALSQKLSWKRLKCSFGSRALKYQKAPDEKYAPMLLDEVGDKIF